MSQLQMVQKLKGTKGTIKTAIWVYEQKNHTQTTIETLVANTWQKKSMQMRYPVKMCSTALSTCCK